MAVELTEREKKSPLLPFFERDIEPVPEEIDKKIWSLDFPKVEKPMTPFEMDKLFEDGYFEDEFGIYDLPDGGVEISNLVDMPGVEPEMFEWWFAWHGLDTMRYKIWDKDDHYLAQSKNPEINLDESLTMRERYLGTTHYVEEALLDGQDPVPVDLKFEFPHLVGFSKEKYDAFDGAIVSTPGPVIMIHFVRKTQKGSELRTRFFVGYDTSTGKPVRIPEFKTPIELSQALLHHGVKEFRHLAKILPELYNLYKDDFKVGLD